METSIILISTVVLLVLLFLKVPVFISILSGSMAYFYLTGGPFTKILGQRVLAGVESIPLLAIPFFICAGVFMNYSGVTKRVMGFCNVMTGRMTGGLAQVNVLLSTLMGGLSGSNLADAAMEAKMLVPEMERHGYSKQFSTVVTAMSSMITPLIPPGIAMILYGSIANISIGKLFIAGIGPGVLLCVAMMILVHFISKKRGYKPMRTERLTMKQAAPEIASAFLPLCLPVIIIGGIRLGIFTPTEAGAVAIVYSLVLGIVYKELKLKDIGTGLKETVATTASIMLIVGGASAFAWILTREQIPQQFTALVLGTIHNKYLFLFVIILFLIVDVYKRQVYKNDIPKAEEGKAQNMITQLYEYYMGHVDKLPVEYVLLMVNKGEKKSRVVCDYIAGMSDIYAIDQFEELFVPKRWNVY